MRPEDLEPNLTIETLAVHAGQEPDELTGAVAPPIYQTSTYRQEGVGRPIDDYDYARSKNPTRDRFERAVAALEGGGEGIAFASGSAATAAISELAGPETDVVVGDDVYGGTFRYLERVRRVIAQGQVAEACSMLTQPYRIRGMVTHGAGRGARIGFATANLSAVDTLLPGPGVYAGRAMTLGGTWPAAINIGPNLTFGEQALKVEVHLIGFHAALYGQPLEVDFRLRLRDIQRFADVEELKGQLRKDVERAVEAAAG